MALIDADAELWVVHSEPARGLFTVWVAPAVLFDAKQARHFDTVLKALEIQLHAARLIRSQDTTLSAP